MARSFYTTHSGALFVKPGGQSECGPDMARAGYSWGAVDIVDGDGWDAWSATTRQFIASGLRVPVWGRVQNASIEEILEVGFRHAKPVILNLEDELKGAITPAEAERRIKAFKAAHPTWTREIVINTVGWLYNSVDYWPIAHRPVQLQILPADMRRDPAELEQITRDCILHAREKGFRDIGVCFQTYKEAKPEWYSYWSGPRTLIWGDVIGAQSAWPQWRVAV